MRVCEPAKRSTSEKRWKEQEEKRGEGWSTGGMSLFSHLSHTDVWGGEEEQEEDWVESRGSREGQTNHLRGGEERKEG